MASWSRVGGFLRGVVQCGRFEPPLKFPPELFPSASNFSITLRMELSGSHRRACIMLRQPPHQKQGLGWKAFRRRAGESLQSSARDGRILLYTQLLLPATQSAKHLIGRFPVDD